MKKKLLLLFFTILTTLTFTLAQVGEWTWMKGSSSNNGSPTFGTIGVPDPDNTPPSLYEAVEWTDHDGNFWLFGGLRDFGSEYNTLWKFDPVTNDWTWINGASVCCQAGVYGTQGIPSPSNTPGARAWGAWSWVDSSGNLWLYGGIGDDAIGGYEVMSDLWKYDIAANEWTWVAGPNNATVEVNYGTLGVFSSTSHPGARAESNASWVDDGNNLWLLGGALYFPNSGGGGFSIGGFGNDLWEFDVNTQLWGWLNGTTVLSGSGIFGTQGVPAAANHPPGIGAYAKWKDSNGDFWFFGGYNLGSSWNTMWRYNIADNMWTWMSGSNVTNNNGAAATQCVPDSNNAPSSRYENRTFWRVANGRFWTFGGIRTSFNNDVQNDLWQYDPFTNEWTWVSGSLLPNQTGSYGTQGVSSPTNVPPSKFGSIGWRDNDGNLWLFGGSDGFLAAKNDLWKYVPDPNCPSIQQSAFGATATQICEKFCTDFIDSSTNNPTSWLWQFPGGTPASSTDQNPTNICYQTPGTFDVTLITASTSGNDTVTLPGFITVLPTPPIPVITQTGNVLTSTPAFSYQWQFNLIDIPGATNQSLTISQSGLYTVIIGDSTGCTTQANFTATLVGIAEISAGATIGIHPNPSNGNFVLEWEAEKNSDWLHIEIYNALGQSVFSSDEKNVNKNFKKEISLSVLARGIYFIEMKTADFSAREKIILSR